MWLESIKIVLSFKEKRKMSESRIYQVFEEPLNL